MLFHLYLWLLSVFWLCYLIINKSIHKIKITFHYCFKIEKTDIMKIEKNRDKIMFDSDIQDKITVFVSCLIMVDKKN